MLASVACELGRGVGVCSLQVTEWGVEQAEWVSQATQHALNKYSVSQYWGSAANFDTKVAYKATQSTRAQDEDLRSKELNRHRLAYINIALEPLLEPHFICRHKKAPNRQILLTVSNPINVPPQTMSLHRSTLTFYILHCSKLSSPLEPASPSWRINIFRPETGGRSESFITAVNVNNFTPPQSICILERGKNVNFGAEIISYLCRAAAVSSLAAAEQPLFSTDQPKWKYCTSLFSTRIIFQK